MRAAIIIALEEELSNAFDCLERYGKFLAPKQSLKEGQTNFRYMLSDEAGGGAHDCQIFLINGMGNVAASTYVGRSFMHSDPDILISVGISGSLHDDVALEDVVISNQVKFYGPDKIGEFPENGKVKTIQVSEAVPQKEDGEYLVDVRDLHGNVYLRFLREHIILREFSSILDEFLHHRKGAQGSGQVLLADAKLVRGTILGSNWVVDSTKYAEYIHWKNDNDHLDYYKLNKPDEYRQRCTWGASDLHAVDMETYGFFKAIDFLNKTRQMKVPGFAIRGISDRAAGKAALDEKSGGSHRAKSVENAMLVVVEFLRFFASQNRASGEMRAYR
ncbi:hypothetical protein [Ciceribacter sp. RN22]|uniref:5'-methylthioadenosine/S-adenosylhomocysteine nucleosidase family protein n=1 Tax=Ciceribacter sp. RN22 TaxID=2954932 RepID=UPI002092A235|nr:hypothetical protein [Ciceribacter sp. RN22]MCO6178047.1 hypothetical protein [Ciceribacter sp. RN22]